MTAPAVETHQPVSHSGAVPMLHLTGFAGPLDLLLHLAERQSVDLGQISILDLVEQFVAALEKLAGHVPIERRAEWQVVAARLLHMRSRLLCPLSPEDAAAAAQEAETERARIQTLGKMRAAAAWLENRPRVGRDVFTRPRPPDQRVTGYVALMQACLTVLRGRFQPADMPVYRPALLPQFWRIADALALIRARLDTYPNGAALRCFLPHRTYDQPQWRRAAIASTLVASLELARAGEVCVDQSGLCEEILLTPNRFGTSSPVDINPPARPRHI